MSELDRVLVNYTDYSGTQALNQLLDIVGVSEVIDAIKDYCYFKKNIEGNLVIESDMADIIFNDDRMFIFKK